MRSSNDDLNKKLNLPPINESQNMTLPPIHESGRGGWSEQPDIFTVKTSKQLRIKTPGERKRTPPEGQQPGGCVLHGLRHLHRATVARLFNEESACSAIQFGPISAVVLRANECAEDIHAECGAVPVENVRRTKRGTVYHHHHVVHRGKFDDHLLSSNIASASKAFQALVTQIEESLHGNENKHQVVRKGDRIPENVPARGVRMYKVILPSKPTEVTVSLNRTGGRPPSLWASTTDQHPGPSNHELKGKTDTIVYKHVLPPGDEDSGVDRRYTAPDCRELFVIVDALHDECQYELSVHYGPANIILSRKELSAQVAKLKQTWGLRVQELQKSNVVREEFEGRLVELRAEAVEAKRRQFDNGDFVRRNIREPSQMSPESKRKGIHKQMLKNFARHDACSARRAELSPDGHKTKHRSQLAQFAAAVVNTPIEADLIPAMETPTGDRVS